MTQLKMIDVSMFQPDYQPGSTDEDVVIVKASEGQGYTDPSLAKLANAVIASGKKLGLYHFYNGGEGNTPEGEAESFWEIVQPYLSAKPMLVLDYEIKGHDYADEIKRFNDKLKALSGSPVWLYAGKAYADEAGKNDMPLWFAMYPYKSSDASPATWDAPMDELEEYTFPISAWQFTTSGGKLDRSIFFGSLDQLNKLAYQGNAEPLQATPAPAQPTGHDQDHKDLADFAEEVMQGGWGQGQDRQDQLGDIYGAVQAIVNFKLGSESYGDMIKDLADEVMAGHIGDGERREVLLGNYYNDVQNLINSEF